jgi:hypothetical protein
MLSNDRQQLRVNLISPTDRHGKEKTANETNYVTYT